MNWLGQTQSTDYAHYFCMKNFIITLKFHNETFYFCNKTTQCRIERMAETHVFDCDVCMAEFLENCMNKGK